MDFFIVTDRKYYKHKTVGSAEEARAIERKKKGGDWRVYRCKSHLKPGNNFNACVRLLKQIRDDGLTDLHRATLAAVLDDIALRDEQARSHS